MRSTASSTACSPRASISPRAHSRPGSCRRRTLLPTSRKRRGSRKRPFDGSVSAAGRRRLKPTMDEHGTSSTNSELGRGASVQSLREALRGAIVSHQAGRLADAERVYQAILGIKSSHFDAMHLLGVVQLQRRRFAEAHRLIGAALAINDRSADAHSHYGSALAALGRHEEALASYERALSLKRDHVNALANRALTLNHLSRYRDALSSCDQALAIAPSLAEAHNNRAIALNHLGEYEQA